MIVRQWIGAGGLSVEEEPRMISHTMCRSTTTLSCAVSSGRQTSSLSDARLAASLSACRCVPIASDTATMRGMTTTCSSHKPEELVIVEMQV